MECDEEGLCDLTTQDRKVEQIVVHQHYQGDQSGPDINVEQLYQFNLEGKTMNNIAIIKLEEKVQETDYVSPICINLRVGFEAEYQTLKVLSSTLFLRHQTPPPALRLIKICKSLAGKRAGDFIIRKSPLWLSVRVMTISVSSPD